jgi:glycosyltransferase involved in cell wall biosynthesis
LPAQRPLKVVVKSPFSIFSGYGTDGFGLLRAFERWGCDVYAQPTWLDVPIPRDLVHIFTRELRAPFDLVVNHWDPEHLSITREARQACRVAVAWTMWEFAGGPGKDGKPVSGLVPHGHGRSKLPRSLRWFDLVLGYDQVSLDALEFYLPKRTHRSILQGGYDSQDWKVLDRDWDSPRFGFAMHGALNARKAPWTAIQAFNELKFERPGPYPDGFDDATFALHTNAPGEIFPELNEPFKEQRLRVFVDVFDHNTLEEFYRSAHCLLAPSRGEGKNLPALEMLTTGGAVAATNFGGHTQWMNADYAYPLDYELTPSFERCPWGAHDAKVSIEHMKDVIWHIYTHRHEAKVKAELGSRIIPQMCDWQVVLEALFRRIRDEVTGPGPEVYELAMACKREAAWTPDAALMGPPGWRRG